jgi:uncharacterized protein (DUF1330 family)
MAVYIVAQITIHDRAEYARYHRFRASTGNAVIVEGYTGD